MSAAAKEAATLGDGILRWMLRRLDQGAKLRQDVVLVRDHDVLRDTPSVLSHGGETWSVRQAVGELSLRDALPRDGEHVIVRIARRFLLPPDVAGRTYLGRVLEVRADDVVAAITGRFAEPIVDDGLAEAVFRSIEALRRFAGFQTLGQFVTVQEVRAALVAAQLGTADTIDRRSPAELLRTWLLDGLPRFGAPGIFEAALREAHGRTGGWLAQAVIDDALESLVTAGALAGSEPAWALVEPPRGVETPGDRATLRAVVFEALRELLREAPAVVERVLARAEACTKRAGWLVEESARLPLLRGALDAALSQFAAAAVANNPVEDEAIEALRLNVHADAATRRIDVVREVSRLARALSLELPRDSATAEQWLELARDHIGWVDLAVRRARRALLGGDTEPGAAEVLERVLTWRNEVNRRFATRLAADWQRLAGSKDLQRPLPVHQVGRVVLRRLIDSGKRVFLVVLDACDHSTLYEMLEALQQGRSAPFALRLPEVENGLLRDDLAQIHAMHTAVAALPTVTNHSRRALFAGELPGNTALDETEAAASNASADHTAFARNTTFEGISRRLFLKGDLVDGGAALVAALRSGNEQLVAVVFNAIDDALSSKETTPLGPWTFEALGSRAFEALATAVEAGWTVIVTADHGHTPFVSTSRKVAARGLATRYHDAPVDGRTVAFEHGPLPRKPLHLLYELGAWQGPQRRGFHGGAGLEEVAVPLAFLGPRDERAELLRPPRWWWAADEPEREASSPTVSEVLPPIAPVEVETKAQPQGSLDFHSPAWLLEIKDGEVRRIFAHLAQHRSITEEEARRMLGDNARKLRRFDNNLQTWLGQVPFKVRIEVTQGGKRYVKDE